MRKILGIWVFLSAISLLSHLHAQGTYFKVVAQPSEPYFGYGDKLYGAVIPVDENKGGDAILNFSGRSKQELYKAIMQYLNERPNLVFKPKSTTEHLIVYRDFVTVGNRDTCLADLAALTYIYAIPEEGMVRLSFGITSEIFSTIYDAKLRITLDDDVASEGDAPFNEYKYVQPADLEMLAGRGRHVTQSLKEAYPESIFDAEGNVVNATNKRIIERYYDWYAIDLNNFLLNYFKQ